MKRTLVFLLLGPTLVTCTAAVMFLPLGLGLVFAVALTNHSLGGLALMFAAMLFLFTFLVAVVTGPIDGYLARTLPIVLRAPLVAIVGGIIAVGLFFALFGRSTPDMPIIITIGGAFCMGVCSLLSHDYRNVYRGATGQP